MLCCFEKEKKSMAKKRSLSSQGQKRSTQARRAPRAESITGRVNPSKVIRKQISPIRGLSSSSIMTKNMLIANQTAFLKKNQNSKRLPSWLTSKFFF
jgi:hypothetical protein